jgi:hypothetical protein
VTTPDTTSDPSATAAEGTSAGDGRLCAYRGCRAALPPPTGRPGNRPKYCQDGKTWGSAELTCKAAEAAYVAVESLQGDAPVSPQNLRELGERLDAVVAPVAQLLTAMTTTRQGLDEEVLTAYAERDAARAAAAADRGAREAAEQDAARARVEAQQARDTAAEAESLRADAERARDTAETTARDAEGEKLRAEGRQAALEERVRRADQLAEEAAELAGRLQVELADRAATLQATEQALAAERDRVRERDRVHREELQEREARLVAARDAHDRQLQQLHEQHDRAAAQQAAAAQAALDAARAEREQALMQLTREHGEELGALRQQLRVAEQNLAQLRDAQERGR